MYKTDNEKQIFFYEQEFYVFSNFSSFQLEWKGVSYPTSEHAYHSEKFLDEDIKIQILQSKSAHEAFKLATEKYKQYYREDWDKIKLDIMKQILIAKVEQHPYVKKKLLESGERELIEDSWRDDFWGWGEDKKGANHLGKMWMEVREIYQNTK